MALSKLQRRQRIKHRIRKVVLGTTTRPRLSVFRSNKEIYAQLVDDTKGTTLISVSSRENELESTGFDKYPSQPAARHFSLSPLIARAVSAIIGTRARSWFCSISRIALVAEKPSITGIFISIRIRSYFLCSCHSSKAILPFSTSFRCT